MKEINLKSSTIEKSLDLAKDFLQTLIGPSVSELGQFFADKVKVWRLKNQINTLAKVQKIIQEENIKPQQVNLKVLLPYLDAVSLEEDDKLQDIWANLLANYVDSSKNLTSVVYPEILRQLSSRDIELLHILQKEKRRQINIGNRKNGLKKSEFVNLIRLTLVKNPIHVHTTGFSSSSTVIDSTFIEFTYFGLQFLEACQRND